MRVITLNTWKGDGEYGLRLADMASGLAVLRPDIVTLQEVLSAPAAGYDTAAHLAHHLNMAAHSLSLRQKQRTVDGRTLDSTSALAVLSRWPVRAIRSVPLTDDARDGERAALIAEVECDGRAITVACLHLTHLTDRDDLRRIQFHEVLAAVSATEPAIVAGDFNAPIEMFDATGLVDTRQACGEPAQSTVLNEDAPASYDHVLFTAERRLRPIRWQTALRDPAPGTMRTPSDHVAVVVDFEWVARARA